MLSEQHSSGDFTIFTACYRIAIRSRVHNSRLPSSVTRTARVFFAGTIHLSATNLRYIPTPKAPATCGRRSVQSMHCRATFGFAPSSARATSIPRLLKPLLPALRHGERPSARGQQQSIRLQRIGNLHTQPSRQMCITRARVLQRSNRRHARLLLAHSIRQHQQRLHRARNLSAREPVIAMPSLLLHHQKTSLHQPRQMPTRCLRTHMRHRSQLTRRQRPPAH